MAELNLKQITDKLNEAFNSEVRQLVFWFDANAEFLGDVDTLDLPRAKVLHLEKDNQFYMKHYLERVDTTGSYLIYAPFAKPDIRENVLADTIRYSREFYADRASLIILDMGMSEVLKPVIQRYIRFFADKKRTQAFADLAIEDYNQNTIETGLMAALCKCRVASFDEVLRCVLTAEDWEENPLLAKFEEYDLLNAFWAHCLTGFGYSDEHPTLEKLAMTLFVTYASKTIHADMPVAWKPYVSTKPGNVIAFLDNLMNSAVYGERFDEISKQMYKTLGASDVFAAMPVEALTECSLFAGIDQFILHWMVGRLENEDTEAKLNERTIPELCSERRKNHFGALFSNAYLVAENACKLLRMPPYVPVSDFEDVVQRYIHNGVAADRCYRYFYFYYDQLQVNQGFERLRELVERVYTNDHLNPVCTNFSQMYALKSGQTKLPKQLDFWQDNLKYAKERTVVIISDAMRYEVGLALLQRLQADEKCTAEISVTQSVLPSITSYGMAALLPHKKVEWTQDGKVLTDGLPCENLAHREKILQQARPKSRCVQFDAIKSLKMADLRSIFNGMEVVYVYHNQIDARGDNAKTENEVFNACEEAIEEIHALIRRLTTQANTVHFIVTADHGFIYKRDELTESDKISGIPGTSKRYCVTDRDVHASGVFGIPFMDDGRHVYCPVGTDLFKAPGSGLNYVHGGCSPQEMLVPVITVKTEKSFKETKVAQIALVNLIHKITKLITTLEFVQTEPVSDVVKQTNYHLYFIDAEGKKVSGEVIIPADKADARTENRFTKAQFRFRNQRYDSTAKYYLVAIDERNGMEQFRHEVKMDIAFADDFGF